jgi:hypothetical protein
VIRVARVVPESLVETLIEVERGCCPFYELTWDRATRSLSIAVSASDHEPALDAIGHALGVTEPAAFAGKQCAEPEAIGTRAMRRHADA